MSEFVAVGAPRRFVSILIWSALAYTDSEMELTRACCFGFDRKRRPGGKVSFLHHINVYFMVAGFTYWSLHPVVDKDLNLRDLGEVNNTILRIAGTLKG